MFAFDIFWRGDSFDFGHVEERHWLCGAVVSWCQLFLFYVESYWLICEIIVKMTEWIPDMNWVGIIFQLCQ